MLFIIRNIYTYISEKLFISFKLLSYSDRHECKQVAYIPDKWKQATDPVQMYWSIYIWRYKNEILYMIFILYITILTVKKAFVWTSF